MTEPTVDDVAWLASAAGRDAVTRAAAALGAGQDPLRATTLLRRGGLTPGEAALALTQARLGVRAAAKLGPTRAAGLLLTDDGLAAATRPVVAQRRAARLAAAPGVSAVTDLGCGLGLDALAFAAAGLQVTGVERDPQIAAMAAANGVPRVITGDLTDPVVLAAALADADAAFLDPARRDPRAPRSTDGGGRRLDPQSWSPPWSWVRELAEARPGLGVVAKLAPGVPRDLAPAWELVWTSVAGDLVEAAAWSPRLARPGVGRAAVLLTAEGRAREVVADDDPFGEDAGGGRAPVGAVGAVVVEPDDALIRAGLVGAVVAALPGGRLLDRRLAYVSADALTPGGWHASTADVEAASPALGRAYAVVDAVPLGALKSAVRRLGAGDVVVKQRGLGLDPVAVRRGLRLRGGGPTYTVLLARLDTGAVAIIAEPLAGLIAEPLAATATAAAESADPD